MVSTTIYNRNEIKQHVAFIFKFIENNDYSMVKYYSDKLLVALLKYYKTRCISGTQFYDLFDQFNYDVLYSTQNRYKREIVLDSLEKIIMEIKSSTKDPMSRIKEIYEDIRHLYGNLKNVNSAQEIIDCFDELEELRPAIEQIGGGVYNYYTTMMVHVGNCESSILRVPQSGMIGEAMWGRIEEKFSEFFESVHKVLAPPVRFVSDRREIYRKLEEDKIPIEDMVEATAMSEEDLRILLQEERMRGDEDGQ